MLIISDFNPYPLLSLSLSLSLPTVPDMLLESLKPSAAKEEVKKAGISSSSVSNTNSVVLSGELDGYLTDFSDSTVEEDESDNDSVDSYLNDMGLKG
jgi:hypothetical protein